MHDSPPAPLVRQAQLLVLDRLDYAADVLRGKRDRPRYRYVVLGIKTVVMACLVPNVVSEVIQCVIIDSK